MRNFSMIFKRDDALLERMLTMRKEGWTYVSLAIIFGVDHSSIYKWCKIRRIPRPKNPISIDIPSIVGIVGLTFNEPHVKTYKEYLEEDRKRRFPKLYRQLTRV